MTIRLAGTVLAFLACAAVAAGQPPAAASGDRLLQRATEARLKAEEDLAESRQRRLEQRKELAAELQKAYEALSEAQAEAKAARESLQRLKADSAGLEREDALAAHKIRSMIAQAASSAGAEVDPSGPIEKMERVIREGFERRLSRIEANLGVTVHSETVVARDGNESRVPVVRVGGYAAYACGGARESCGLLGKLDDGRRRVVGPYLDAAQAEALRAAAGGSLAHLPLDVDGSLRDRAPAEPMTITGWLRTGGLFIYPIIVVGAVGLILVIERVAWLFLTKTPPPLVNDTLARLRRGDVSAARKLLTARKTPASRVLLAGVDALGRPKDQRESAMESALLAEAPRLERSLLLLAALAGVAPLLGLLGTVSGMISTFDTISATGTGNPRLLSGGISEALITTQLGLVVAIPLLLAHAGLRRWVERREAMLEHDAIRVLGLEDGNLGEKKT